MFQATEKPWVCTTPLYYANGPPHMGSAYPTIAADVISRYQKLQAILLLTDTIVNGYDC